VRVPLALLRPLLLLVLSEADPLRYLTSALLPHIDARVHHRRALLRVLDICRVALWPAILQLFYAAILASCLTARPLDFAASVSL